MDLADDELAGALARGDREALEPLIRRWQPHILSLARRLLHDEGEARDVCQSAWVTLLERGHSFEGKARFSTWLYRVIVNRCRDQQRAGRARERREARRSQEHGHTSASSPAGELEQRELSERVAAALHALPESEREVIVMRHYHDLTLARISEILEVPATTLRSRLVRAMEQLRVHLAVGDNSEDRP